MPTADEIEQQRRRLAQHRATLAHYLDQVSQLGSAYTPPGVPAGIREAREGIARCKAALGAWGVSVEDHPDDVAAGPASLPVPDAANVERDLRAALPPDQQAQAPGLARILSALGAGELSEAALRERLDADPAFAQLLRALVGREVSLGGTALAFGEGSQVGDVTIRDVAGGDLINLTLNVYHGAPAPRPAQPPPPVGERRPLRVFLCHSSADKAAVRRLANLLIAGGAEPWLDERKLLPGQDWRRAIPAAVEGSDVVLVLLSRDAVSREGYLRDEIAFALSVAERHQEDEIFLVPLLLEPCDVPARLARWHWVRLDEPEGLGRLERALRVRAAELGVIEPALSADGWPLAEAAPVVAQAPDPPPAEPPPQLPALKERDPRLVAARGLVAQGRWAVAVARYEALATEGMLPARDAANLERAREEHWLAEGVRMAEVLEKGWSWSHAVTIWEAIVARRPDHPDAGARLVRAREEQVLAAQAQDAADLAEQAEWEGVLAVLGTLAQQREGYAHPQIDLGALRRQAEAALAHERAVELADQGNWTGVIATLEPVPEADRAEELAALLNHARAEQRAEAERKAREAEAARRAEERRQQEEARRRQREAAAAVVDLVKAGKATEAVAQLKQIAADQARKPQAALLAARLAETAAVPLAERFEAARLAGELGDPRVPVTSNEWARELGRRHEQFGAQPWADAPPPYWCYVPAGTYPVGGWDQGAASTTLALSACWIARLLVTVAQYAPFVAEGYGPGAERWWTPEGWKWKQAQKRTKPYRWDQPGYNGANQPVIGVTWHEATAYGAWLTTRLAGTLPAGLVLRLPTEAEWETAASFDGGKERRPYPWGKEPPSPERAIYDASQLGKPAPVGCCPAGAAACGALDLAGNVWEVQASAYGAYPAGAHAPQKDLTDGRAAWRGGSWYNNETYVRCGARVRVLVGFRSVNYFGFRLVLAPPLAHMS